MVNCFICKNNIDCKCETELNIKLKYRTCAMGHYNNTYPQSYGSYHICSLKCNEINSYNKDMYFKCRGGKINYNDDGFKEYKYKNYKKDDNELDEKTLKLLESFPYIG